MFVYLPPPERQGDTAGNRDDVQKPEEAIDHARHPPAGDCPDLRDAHILEACPQAGHSAVVPDGKQSKGSGPNGMGSNRPQSSAEFIRIKRCMLVQGFDKMPAERSPPGRRM